MAKQEKINIEIPQINFQTINVKIVGDTVNRYSKKEPVQEDEVNEDVDGSCEESI